MSAADIRLYFAYGSNLHPGRMVARVPTAVRVAVARLNDYRLTFAKWGEDGSGKCDVAPADGDVVWGVVYRIDASEQHRLDAAEGPGYRIETVSLATDDGALEAFTYIARPDWLTDDPPYDWYRDIVAAGVREHGLPADYMARIESVATVPDLRPGRVPERDDGSAA